MTDSSIRRVKLGHGECMAERERMDGRAVLLLLFCLHFIIKYHYFLRCGGRHHRQVPSQETMSTRFAAISFSFLGLVLGFSTAFTLIATTEQSCRRIQNRNYFSALGATKISEDDSTSRRSLLQNTLTTAFVMGATVIYPHTAAALDFDAFESSQISQDSTSANPDLSEDEALCKYGAPGKAMGEACKRANMKPRLPQNVSADGKADRGDYVKCVDQWSIVGDKYVKTRECKSIKEWGPEVK